MSIDPSPALPVESEKRASRLALSALVCGIWFLLTGWMWIFAINVVISYPVAVLGLILWTRARKIAPTHRLAKAALWTLVAGLAVSLGSLLLYK